MTTADISTKHSASKRTRAKNRGTSKSRKPACNQETDVANGSRQHVNGKPSRKAPVPYSDEIANRILSRLEAGESLLSVCSSDDMPDESAVRKWAADPAHPFSPKYARAREIGYLKMADEVIALSDGLEEGENRFEPGVVQRHRLMVDSRKWLLSKALPKIFGDRLQAEVSGPDGGPMQVEAATAIKAILEALPDLTLNGSTVPAIAAPDGEGS